LAISLLHWLTQHFETARAIVKGAIPDGLDDWVDRVPDWAVLAIAAVVLIAFVRGPLWWLFKLLRRIFDPKGAKRAAPATGADMEAMEARAKAAEERAAAAEKVALANTAKLDQILSVLAANTNPSQVDATVQAGKEAAAERIVEKGDAAQQKAADLIAQGRLAEGFDLLAADAETGDAAQAQKWRDLGALAYGVDTARALAAYERAAALDPSDFWTQIYCAWLYQEAGRLQDARRAAEAAERAASTDRERSVAGGRIGDVLVKAGDLSGAKARFEESLALAEKLAAANPGSAEAQRDLIVSCAKLAGIFPKQGWWAKTHAIALRLQQEGRLAPADAWMVEVCATRAAEDV
jgi:tetratricopeptide (TPR) repeat protein